MHRLRGFQNHLPCWNSKECVRVFQTHAQCLLSMTPRSHSKAPAVKGRPQNRTMLSSETFQPRLLPTAQDSSRRWWGSRSVGSYRSRYKEIPLQEHRGSGAPEGYSDRCWQNAFSRSFLFLHLAETKWNSQMYLPFTYCLFAPNGEKSSY